MGEAEARRRLVAAFAGWLGYSEDNGKYREIIDLYNTQRPLPRGYRMQYEDDWCAAAVTAAGIKAGLGDIILGECSCPKMVELYRARGQWMERDDYRPQIGDIIMYRWDDGADYATDDNRDSPNHVGVVSYVAARAMVIIEGNRSRAVRERTVEINGRYIRGYCLPDYKSKEEEPVTYEEWVAFMERYQREQGQQDAKMAELYQDAVRLGITDGSRPGALATREEAAVMARAAAKAKQ